MTTQKIQVTIFVDTDDVRKYSFIVLTISLSTARCARCLTLMRARSASTIGQLLANRH